MALVRSEKILTLWPMSLGADVDGLIGVDGFGRRLLLCLVVALLLFLLVVMVLMLVLVLFQLFCSFVAACADLAALWLPGCLHALLTPYMWRYRTTRFCGGMHSLHASQAACLTAVCKPLNVI